MKRRRSGGGGVRGSSGSSSRRRTYGFLNCFACFAANDIASVWNGTSA